MWREKGRRPWWRSNEGWRLKCVCRQGEETVVVVSKVVEIKRGMENKMCGEKRGGDRGGSK